VTVAEPGVRLSIDGQWVRDFRGQTRVRADPGEHTVVAEKAGFIPAIQRPRVSSRGTAMVELAMRPEGTGPGLGAREIVAGGTIVLGGAAVVTGVVMGVLAVSATSEVHAHCADGGAFAGMCDRSAPELADTARAQGTAAIVLITLGAAAATGGLVVLLEGGDESPEVAFTVGPAPRVALRW
jgi:hypothetical protein